MPARVAAVSEPEFLANAEQGADCAKAGFPALRIGSFVLFLHAIQRAAIPGTFIPFDSSALLS